MANETKVGLKIAALVVAAGRGVRAGGGMPKQYQLLGGRSLLRRTLEVFEADPAITTIQVVIGEGQAAAYREALIGLDARKLASEPAQGGDTRQASVLAGLDALSHAPGGAPDVVLIHDAARPFVSQALTEDAIGAALTHGAAVPGAAVTDTITLVENNAVTGILDRGTLRAIQTPQAFRFDLIHAAHRVAAERGESAHPDDGSVARAAGHPVHVFPGDPMNRKITTIGDIEEAERRLAPAMVSRTGQGFDVHAFGEGDHVMLCGIKVAHDRGFIAHSDGDVALHALTDALLAALADGDIGRHFPPSDERWKGASSDRFLSFAAERVNARQGRIDLLDVTILCELPKIGPHAERMRERIAGIVGVDIDCVSVKATTTERLGFTGRKEGIAAMASATIRLPDQPRALR